MTLFADLASAFAPPPITARELEAVLATVGTLADPDAQPIEIPTPQSCLAAVPVPVADGGSTLGAAPVPERKPDRRLLAMLAQHLQREANAQHLPVRFYVRDAGVSRLEGTGPDGKLVVQETPYPAAVIAARVMPTPHRA